MNSQPASCHGRIATFVALATSFLAMPAVAQDPMTFCAYQPALDELTGAYTVTEGPGVLSSGAGAIPLPNVAIHRSSLAMVGGTLVLSTGDSGPIDLHPVNSEEPDWQWADSLGGQSIVSSEELAMLLDCDVNSLVRLVGTGTGTSQEGRQFEFRLQLVAAFNGMLVGGQSSWSVDGISVYKRVLLQAVAD